ncbi:hypothetical protein NNJEOMEG_01631 [Fundidesulfovibrio magnetotacticus]|uniref:DUF169 domain-containing protein n=1 Tax=Fundidesulfovibrio magnetotacticus TaxID=2730080 RepID=A0A6V8LVV3_9BACT|nr:DUF169 domain-containing protein [Fundidesulfovibrio magnetotacticus]GFK93797.1 hypothetical protein NNJEOMEG_01631 [Fundidesulfovibrio magnetotacticus]
MTDETKAFLEVLDLDGEPYGMHSTDEEPASGYSPKAGPPVSRELEQAGAMDWQAVWGSFSCVLGNLWLARRKNLPAYFEAARYGCPGASFYLGFHAPQLDFITCYVSTGVPGTPVHGERYLPDPATARRLFEEIPPRMAPARFRVFKPLSAFESGETPETITFFVRPEQLCGLGFLASFVTGDFEALMSPFGAGCACMTTWPLHYLSQGRLKAVLGGLDPSERKFLATDELTLTVPKALFDLFVERWRDSYLTTDTWAGIRKKIARSAEAWARGKGGE